MRGLLGAIPGHLGQSVIIIMILPLGPLSVVDASTTKKWSELRLLSELRAVVGATHARQLAAGRSP